MKAYHFRPHDENMCDEYSAVSILSDCSSEFSSFLLGEKKDVDLPLLDGTLLPRTRRSLHFRCRRCLGCRKDLSEQWALRCMHESVFHDKSSFLTLTYRPSCLPRNSSLVLSDVQKFIRALRDRGHKFRYFLTGEYGSLSGRPHYHALIFGEDFLDQGRTLIKHNDKTGVSLYKSDYLADVWRLGFVSIGDLTFKSAAYCARYSMKKLPLGEPDADDKYGLLYKVPKKGYRLDGDKLLSSKSSSIPFNVQKKDSRLKKVFKRKPEFQIMSLKPGIGYEWFKKYHSDVFPSDFVVFEGKKYLVPDYYFDLYKLWFPEKAKLVMSNREINFDKLLDKKRFESTPERLAVKEEVFNSRFSELKRSLS